MKGDLYDSRIEYFKVFMKNCYVLVIVNYMIFMGYIILKF